MVNGYVELIFFYKSKFEKEHYIWLNAYCWKRECIELFIMTLKTDKWVWCACEEN
jgi:hypothetical protein